MSESNRCRFLRTHEGEWECGYYGEDLDATEVRKCIIDEWSLPWEQWACYEPDDGVAAHMDPDETEYVDAEQAMKGATPLQALNGSGTCWHCKVPTEKLAGFIRCPFCTRSLDDE